jgi:hypothetical protein
MDTTRPRMLIVSSQDWIGISRIPRLARLAGANITVLAPPDSQIAASSHVAEHLPCSYDADETLDLLRVHLEAAPRYDWVVLGDDVLLDKAVGRFSESWLRGLFPLSADAVSALPLVSKISFSSAMHAAGVPMPAGRAASGAHQIASAAAVLGFPVIAKPDRGFAGRGLFSAASPAELREGAKTAAGDYIVESLLEGRMGSTPVLFDRGRAAWWSSYLKSGVWPQPFGPSCRRLAFEPRGIEAILERTGASLGLHGLFGLDWLLTSNEELFVIELNGRPVPMNEGCAQVSQGLPAALRDFLAGRFTVRRPPADDAGALWHAMPASYLLARAEGDRLLAARLALGIGEHTDIPWHDLGLLNHNYLSVIRAIFNS